MYEQQYGLTELRIWTSGVDPAGSADGLPLVRGDGPAGQAAPVRDRCGRARASCSTAGLNVVNPDALIARTNLTRPHLDAHYVATVERRRRADARCASLGVSRSAGSRRVAGAALLATCRALRLALLERLARAGTARALAVRRPALRPLTSIGDDVCRRHPCRGARGAARAAARAGAGRRAERVRPVRRVATSGTSPASGSSRPSGPSSSRRARPATTVDLRPGVRGRARHVPRRLRADRVVPRVPGRRASDADPRAGRSPTRASAARIAADQDGYPGILGYRGRRSARSTGATVVAVAAAIEAMMARKSDDEIALIRESARWCAHAHRLLQEYTRPGVTEAEASLRAGHESTLAMLEALGDSLRRPARLGRRRQGGLSRPDRPPKRVGARDRAQHPSSSAATCSSPRPARPSGDTTRSSSGRWSSARRRDEHAPALRPHGRRAAGRVRRASAGRDVRRRRRRRHALLRGATTCCRTGGSTPATRSGCATTRRRSSTSATHAGRAGHGLHDRARALRRPSSAASGTPTRSSSPTTASSS